MQEELPGMPARIKAPRKKTAAERPQWSGPIPGQTVMHPRRLGELSYGVDAHDVAMGVTRPESRHMETDPHGFVQQVHDVSPMGKQFQDLDIDRNTVGLHSSHGGSIKTRSVQEHWDKQPQTRVRADTPVHSTQWHGDTEGVGDIESITRELTEGGKIKDPVWLVKDMGKLYALDGHHRITAARRAGMPDYPARIWDRDAERAKKS